jgi:hypothetical protein
VLGVRTMTRSRNLILGGAAFLAAHAVEVYRWRDWFDPSNKFGPWFLNNGGAIIVTAVAVAAAAALSTWLWARSARHAGRQSLEVAGGAALAMAITLIVVGPGNMFPIVLAIGTMLVTISALWGGWLGFAAARCLGTRLDRPESP